MYVFILFLSLFFYFSCIFFKIEEQITKLNSDDRNLTNRIQKEQMELGKLTQLENNYQETLKKRLDVLQSVAKELENSKYFLCSILAFMIEITFL
jgi:predicted PurR-regulated permease PerM